MIVLFDFRGKLIALAAAVLLVGEFSCCWPCAAQTTSTWTNNGATADWSDPANWENDPPADVFPDGGEFDVEIERGNPNLDSDITVGSLTLGSIANEGGIVTGGRSLTAEIGALIGQVGGFRNGGGTFTSEGGIDVQGGFVVDGWNVNANGQVTLGVGSGNGSDRVAAGDFSPAAPTDPYVRALAHTVPQVMVSLRA